MQNSNKKLTTNKRQAIISLTLSLSLSLSLSAGDGACGVVPSAAGDSEDAGASGAAALLSGNSGRTWSSKDQTKYKINTRSQNK